MVKIISQITITQLVKYTTYLESNYHCINTFEVIVLRCLMETPRNKNLKCILCELKGY